MDIRGGSAKAGIIDNKPKKCKMKKSRPVAELVFIIAILALLSSSALAQDITARSWYQKGSELMGNGSLENAVKAYDKAIMMNPYYADAWSSKAAALSALGKNRESLQAYDKALGLYNKNLNKDPKDAVTWYNKGNALNDRSAIMQAMGNNSQEIIRYQDDAIKAYDTAIESDPEFANAADAYQHKGALLSMLGRYREALQAFNKTLEIDPERTSAQEGKGQSLAALGRKNESAIYYSKALETADITIKRANSTQSLSAAWLSKGFALQELGRFREAVVALDNSTVADTRNTAAWKMKGILLLKQLRSYNRSIEAFDMVLQMDPKDAQVQSLKGDALYRAGRLDDASKAYDKAIKLNQKDEGFWLGKAAICMKQRKYKEATDYFNKSLVLDPANTSAWSGKAVALFQQKRYNQSVVALNRAIEKTPKGSFVDLSALWSLKASILQESGRTAEAEKAVDTALQMDQKNAGAWLIKGDFLRGRKNDGDAIKAYDMAIQIVPKTSPQAGQAWYNKGLSLKALGRISEANTAFAKAKDLGYEVGY